MKKEQLLKIIKGYQSDIYAFTQDPKNTEKFYYSEEAKAILSDISDAYATYALHNSSMKDLSENLKALGIDTEEFMTNLGELVLDERTISNLIKDENEKKALTDLAKGTEPFEVRIDKAKEILKDKPELFDSLLRKGEIEIRKAFDKAFDLTNPEKTEANIDAMAKLAGEGFELNGELTLSLVELSRTTDKNPKHEELEEFKKTVSEEDAKILDEVDIDLKQGDLDLANKINHIYEHTGNFREYNETDDALEYLKGKGYGDDVSKIKHATNSIDIAKGAKSMDNMAAYLGTETYHFDDKTIASLTEAYNLLVEASPNFEIEDLTNKGKELSQAVLSHDMDKVKAAKLAYEETYAKFDKIYKLLSETNPDFRFQTNLSQGRSPNIPNRFRNDLVGASRFRELCLVAKFSKDLGVKFEDYLKDPMATISQLNKNLDAANPSNKWLKENSATNIIRTLGDNSITSNHEILDFANHYGLEMGVGMSMFTSYCKNEDAARLVAYRSIYNSAINAATSLNAMSILNINNNSEKLAYILGCESKDRNIAAIPGQEAFNISKMATEKPFNLAEYIRSGSTTPEAVTDRMLDMFNHSDFNDLSGIKNDLMTAYEMNADIMLGMKDIKLESGTKRILNMMSLGTPEKISETDISIFKAQKALSEDLKFNNAVKADANTHIKNLFALQADYNARPLYKRIFGWFGETARLRSAISSVKTTLTREIGAEELNEKLDILKANGEMPENSPVLDNSSEEAEMDKKLNKEAYTEAMKQQEKPRRWPYTDNDIVEATSEVNNDFDQKDFNENVLDNSFNEKDFKDDELDNTLE